MSLAALGAPCGTSVLFAAPPPCQQPRCFAALILIEPKAVPLQISCCASQRDAASIPCDIERRPRCDAVAQRKKRFFAIFRGRLQAVVNQSALPQLPPTKPCWRHASNTTTATAFDRFKLRLPGRIGSRMR